MVVLGNTSPFKEWNISIETTGTGIYILYSGGEIIYIGKADSDGGIKRKLADHKKGSEGPCTLGANAYKYELNSSPQFREKELLAEHMRAFGKLPRCNVRFG